MALVPPPRLPPTARPRRADPAPRRAAARRTVAVAVLALTGPAVALPAGASAASCGGANRTVASQGAARAEAAVRCLVNQRRAGAGLGALRFDRRAANAAQRHTNDMVRRRYFDHTSPGGSSVADRVNATGMRWSNVGENIAAGQRTPAAVVRGWMRSPGHRANIMDGRFTTIGVGASRKGTAGFRGPTWTQVFARPR